MSLAERSAWAGRFGRLVAADQEGLARLVGEEIGKPAWETLVAEVMPLVASARWHARRGGRLLSDRRLPGRPWWMFGQSARVRRVPLGRVGIIATWNYPIQLLGIQILQAVMAGNRVVVKPSERSPRSQRRLLELARAAGLPEGVLESTASDREAGVALLADPDLDHLVFTGST
ncbi:MAG: aldehyde dehydrogenase family protein, partial [Phycisphaerales bacterium]|nr:aldehyde dehydrogenase family protein [Phycisphaerales bacterium]